jgi:hypothetical protein
VEAVLASVIVVLLVSFWIPHPPIGSRTPSSHVASRQAPASAAQADAIVATHLFGQAPAAAPTPNVAAPSMTVDGIVYASEKGDSEVVLTINGKTDVYRNGAKLPDGETVTIIGPGDLELAENGRTRHLVLSRYGTSDSEGPAAYAALLHGTGFSAPETDPALASLPGVPPTGMMEPLTPLSPVPLSISAVSIPSARAVQISPTATPLEQLQALRQQLIHKP